MMNKHNAVPFTQVKITDGFWKMRQDLNADTTIYAVKKRFEETGRFAAYQGHWREGMPHKPYFLLTGDIEKWMESVAYLLQNGKCAELEAVCDEVIDLIERNQFPDGYFNMWLMQTDPTRRWTNRDWHELYAIGHLIEAAVAYYQATGKDKLVYSAIGDRYFYFDSFPDAVDKYDENNPRVMELKKKLDAHMASDCCPVIDERIMQSPARQEKYSFYPQFDDHARYAADERARMPEGYNNLTLGGKNTDY